MNNIIVVGSANVDLNSYSSSLPKKGETILGHEFKTSLGGKGANQCIQAAKLNQSRRQIHMVCKVGKDDFGKELIDNFKKTNVKYSSSDVYSEKHTGIATINVDSEGENTIVVCPGSNHDLTASDVEKQLKSILKNDEGDQNGVRNIVLTQLEIPLEAALKAVQVGKECEALTILNPAPAPQTPLDPEFYKFVDIIIPNETELKQLVPDLSNASIEDMAKGLLDKGVQKAVIVTMGKEGAMIVERMDGEDVQVTMVSAPDELKDNQDPVIDTVGAGDSFSGALSHFIASGLSITDSAIKACGVAGLSVRKQGAQSSYPHADELPDCLRVSVSSDVSTVDRPKKVFTFVTGNKKKLEEVQTILGGESMNFELTNKKLDLPELQGNDPVQVAIEKCKLAAQEVNGPVFTEDTSLCFNALNGLPGLYIKWFLEKCGHDGLNKMLDGFEDRSAYAQTVVAFTIGVGEEIHTFDGRTDGKIVAARGPLDFGWDPIFEPNEGGGKTYAEMTKEDKNKISHRGRSFEKFRAFLSEMK